MFTRIMSMVLVVILLLTAGLTAVGVVMLRNRQTSARLEAIKKDAREIAWLAAQNRTSTAALMIGMDNQNQMTLSWKAAQVYEEFGAFIIVVDRRGRLMDNFNLTQSADPDFASSLDGKDLNEALNEVLAGNEVTVRTNVDGAPTFTVGVPFLWEERVLGAVLIQTPARKIEGGLQGMLPRVLLVALSAILVAGISLFLYIRQVMKPLRAVSFAARSMAEGDFSARVAVAKASPEVEELSTAFNSMADKLSATEQSRKDFVANVSHELKSPITAISGFVQGMEDGTIPPEEHPKYLELVGQESRRLSKLIGDLLSLSRLEREDAALKCADFDICEMLRRAIIRRVNDLERRHMEVECDFRCDPCVVWADSDRMEQVIVNLLDNAIKFTPDGGRITLRTEDSGSTYTVTVADNGCGIPPEDRDRVFERFFTSDRAHTSGKGTGLGLSICQRIMAMHGQSIRLLNTDVGAAFALTLQKGTPRAKGRVPEETAS